MWQRFTNNATRVIHFAQEEAQRMGTDVVGTEHILLGLLREGEGIAARVLEHLGVSLVQVRTELNNQAESSGNPTARPTRLTLSPKAKKALEYALYEARELNPKLGLLDFVDTEHVLLGLIREGISSGSTAVRVLDGLGVNPERIRQEVLKAIGVSGVYFDVDQLPLDQSNKHRLTQRAKKALQYAMMEASRYGQQEMGPEHLLLGLAQEGDGVAGRTLVLLGVSLGRLRALLGEPTAPEAVARGTGPVVVQALAHAVEELEDFHVKYGALLFLDTEHLLLGLLSVPKEEGNTAIDLLADLGVDLRRVRQEVLAVMRLVAPVRAKEKPVAPERKGVDVWLSLSEPAFRVLTLAGEEAHRQGTEVIDVPHLAVGLLRFNEAALARQNVLMNKVRIALFGKTAARGAAALSLSPLCADVLGLAYQAALKDTPAGALVRITPAHLAQGLLDGADAFEYDTVRKLAELGVDLERFKTEL